MVGEQLITKWNPTKKTFETVIYDKFMWMLMLTYYCQQQKQRIYKFDIYKYITK
jgi:hypothetical protein